MNVDMEFIAILLLVIGIIMFIIEIFVPSFGIIGGLGIVGIIAGIVMTADTLLEGVLLFLGIAAILLIVIMVAWKFVFKNGRTGIILQTVVDKEDQTLGDLHDLIDKIGMATTPLRPSGIADFNGVRLDVLTKGEFIQKGSEIQIIEIVGKKIIVKQIHPSRDVL